MFDVAHLDRALADLHRDRRFILAMDVAAAATPLVDDLTRWGAGDLMVLCAALGAGALPDCEITQIDTTNMGSLSGNLNALGRLFFDPSPSITKTVDRFDPICDASVIMPPFLRKPDTLRRRTIGARPAPWRRLEDKTTVDELWDSAGVTSAPRKVVGPGEAPAAATELATDLGTVWAVDNTRGWHGGVDGTRWVPDEAAAARVSKEFSWADQVRVMPFLDGIPCSIHGIVTRTGVAVTRPVEILIMRDMTNRAFFYGGTASTWDPSSSMREEMRQVARLVGEHLSATVGYRGAFGIDGVATADGFLPNELNPRFSAGVSRVAAGLTGLNLEALDWAIVDGDLDVDHEALEVLILAAAENHRQARCNTLVAERRGRDERNLGLSEGRLALADGGEAGVIDIGPVQAGSFLRATFKPDAVGIGASLAPWAIKAFRLAASAWDLDIPQLAPAPDFTAPGLTSTEH